MGWLTKRKPKVSHLEERDGSPRTGSIKLRITMAGPLRSRKNDVPGMKRAVEATLRRMSTDDAPKHDRCPDGLESWCSYNRAVAKGKKPLAHKNSLPNFVCEALEPVFKCSWSGAATA